MAIGILALAIGGVCLWISSLGIGDVERPAQAEKTVRYPYPEELA